MPGISSRSFSLLFIALTAERSQCLIMDLVHTIPPIITPLLFFRFDLYA